MRRPILFLDVDGVLNMYGKGPTLGRVIAHDLFPGDDEPVRLDSGHGPLINQLRDVFEVVWATSWNDQANTLLAPLLGIPVLPVAAMPPAPFEPSAKIAVLTAHARNRAAAWIDDLHPPEAQTWAANRTAPTLLLMTDPSIGLTHRLVSEAIAWGQNLRTVSRT